MSELSDMLIKVVSVTPKMACEWLATKPDWRMTPIKLIDAYVDSMRNKEWNPQSAISIDENGVLVDGTKRLVALVAYGHPVEMSVIRPAK